MAGILERGYQAPQAPKKPTKKKETYAASIEQQAQDYDALMNRYKSILDAGPDPQLASLMSQYSAAGTPVPYQRGPEMGDAFGNLNELSRTGGYDESNIADLRARGISPIRAVYSNAMQNITRQKALQGGYSPNYTASMAKLARDLSESISSGTQNVNAGIAQNVASNRLSAAPAYLGAAQNETSAINEANARNAATKFNSLGALSSLYGNERNNKLAAIQGMASLYGTTPALPALYGQQALSTAQLQEQQRARKQNASNILINAYSQGRGIRYPSYGSSISGARF